MNTVACDRSVRTDTEHMSQSSVSAKYERVGFMGSAVAPDGAQFSGKSTAHVQHLHPGCQHLHPGSTSLVSPLVVFCDVWYYLPGALLGGLLRPSSGSACPPTAAARAARWGCESWNLVIAYIIHAVAVLVCMLSVKEVPAIAIELAAGKRAARQSVVRMRPQEIASTWHFRGTHIHDITYLQCFIWCKELFAENH